jgi:type II secretory pathway component GspD/PulD (secretin)
MKRMLFALVIATVSLRGVDLLALDAINAAPDSSELISEEFPIKYAKASELGALLESTNKIRPTILARFTKYDSQLLGVDAIEHDLEKMGWRQVASDERSNSLYIRASKHDLTALKNIIATLDVGLSQILVETVIIEFPITEPTATPRIATDPHPALTALNNLGVLVNTTFPFQQTNTGQLNQYSYLATLRGDLDSMVNALATNTSARILQRPRIQTSEGEPAQLFVGAAWPYPRGAYYSGGAFSCGCHSSIQSVNIGTTFEVTCLLPAKDLIQMDINMSRETANGTVTIANVGEVPITMRDDSRAQTFLRNGEVIAVGGCIDTNRVSIFSGIDRLDRIPGGGYLNKLITYPKRNTRNEVILLMRAIVLPTPELAHYRSKDALPRIRPPEPEVP